MSVIKYILSPTDFENWQALYDLLHSLFSPMESRIDPPSSFTQLTPELLREKAEAETLLAVYDKDTLVACAFFKEISDAIYLGKVAVDAGYQRRGIAREIIANAAKFARSLGKQSLELQTRIELIENHKSFAALGFVKSGESAHVGYDRPTSITMRKWVG